MYAGDTIVDFSNSIKSLKTVVSVIFVIQCADIFLDLLVSVRNAVRVFAVEQIKTENVTWKKERIQDSVKFDFDFDFG